jgi:hypothetical protein
MKYMRGRVIIVNHPAEACHVTLRKELRLPSHLSTHTFIIVKDEKIIILFNSIVIIMIIIIIIIIITIIIIIIMTTL